MTSDDIIGAVMTEQVEVPIGTKAFVVMRIDQRNAITCAGSMTPDTAPMLAWHLLNQIFRDREQPYRLAKPGRKGGPKPMDKKFTEEDI